MDDMLQALLTWDYVVTVMYLWLMVMTARAVFYVWKDSKEFQRR